MRYYPSPKKQPPLNSIPTIITTLESKHNYSNYWQHLERHGRKMYGPKFRLYDEDAEVIAKLLIWALRDEELAPHWNIDPRKGILLAGPVGCGKTSLMNILRHMLILDARHLMKSCREVAFEFSNHGYAVIARYGRQSFQPGTELPLAICFDDLGLEPAMQHYGSACNVMGEVLLSRYDCYTTHGMVTHITTNLNSSELEAHYGPRIRSRMRELCNLVAFARDAPDKRT